MAYPEYESISWEQLAVKRCVLLATVVLLLSACGYVPFSSGKLEGTVTPVPADWSGLAEASIVQLETNPDDPYSVKLWVIGLGSSLYVHAGDNLANWVAYIQQNPDVRLLMDGSIYELRAERVRDAAEFERFSGAYEKKYGSRPRNENVAEVYLFRLEAR
jgi:hypothetical protein